jgi:hypothetical protein
MRLSLLAGAALLALLATAPDPARAAEGVSYPDWSGQWVRIGGSQFDPARAPARGQEAPLTEEYRSRFEALLRKPPADGVDNSPTALCTPPGMPRAMIAELPMEILIRPGTVYVMLSYLGGFRHIFTDGRSWPAEIEPGFDGTSIGRWQGTELLVETRGLNGPRSFDASGLPLHDDNETLVTERIFLDPADPDMLHDEITTIDHALTRPWQVTRSYRRVRDAAWPEHVCAEEHQRIAIGGEIYTIGSAGRLEPMRAGQPAPDLRYFGEAKR